ncbi:hypothetical protein N7468_000360 [Penicillium chermesinum]|uniref:PRISE-like Rossmann-fold domain-containing protein n=1 Tax=Penicillium chermesinum TaxID=63820 RepID=A0A9W9PLF8_9EURO|nr:uncharacterized protein N7468_000360 [Penicillium chermesinum]KAJ5248909.1 hypothetical protein N7468_000360 [Penicillium chermesinum]KAJ6151011.1 hypothetical protein N7470_007605 [Penicillium chermesinum]
MADARNHAIVYGASGIIGWALVDQLLKHYPAPGTFSKVTAITNRPLDLSKSFWPEKRPTGPELELVSGINLSSDGVSLADILRERVKDIENVTHVYYLVFTAMEDDVEEVATNYRMFQRVIDVHNVTSPRLKFVAFPGGTRGYGIYVPGGTFTPPLREEMVKSLPSDYSKTVVYPAYREMLTKASDGKSWTWCEVCPDTIIGFTPNGSQFSLALHWAQYLSLYAFNHDIKPRSQSKSSRVEVPFPGSTLGANSLHTPVSSKILARFMIYASLSPEKCGGGRLFNIADRAKPCTANEVWPQLASWFGLKGVQPPDTEPAGEELKAGQLPNSTPNLLPGEYTSRYQRLFAEYGCLNAAHAGVGVGNRQLDSVGYWLTFDRQLSLDRIRECGFEEEQDPVKGWLESFELFQKAGLIL